MHDKKNHTEWKWSCVVKDTNRGRGTHINTNRERNSVERVASNNEFLSYVSLARPAIYDNGVEKIAVSLKSLGECSSPMICLSSWVERFLGIYAFIEVTSKWTLFPDSDLIFPQLSFPLEQPSASQPCFKHINIFYLGIRKASVFSHELKNAFS